MNPEKLKKLQAEVRIGGKGTQRRKKKVVHTTAASEDKKLQQNLKKLSLNSIPGIEEVNIIQTDGTVVNIKNPKTLAAVSINTFAITGNGVERTVYDMLPGIMPQLGKNDLERLHEMAQHSSKKSKTEVMNKKTNNLNVQNSKDSIKSEAMVDKDSDDDDDDIGDDDDEEVPDLVDNFEAVALS